MLDALLASKSPYMLTVQLHGIAAMSFALVFLLEAFGLSFPLVSLTAQHPDFEASKFSAAQDLWVAVAIGTFATYEVFFIPYLPAQFEAKLKVIFFVYHIGWAAMITYMALLPGALWTSWISVAVMYGFTIAGAVVPAAS